MFRALETIADIKNGWVGDCATATATALTEWIKRASGHLDTFEKKTGFTARAPKKGFKIQPENVPMCIFLEDITQIIIIMLLRV